MKGGFIDMKKNVKRFVSMTMAMLVAAGSLAGCGGGGSASTGESAKAAANTGGSSGGAVTVKVSLSQAATEPPVKAAEYFKEIVEERSNGEIKVEIYPDNQLGNERDVIEGMQLGTVEMAMTSVAPFSSFVPSVNIFCLPFLWRDKEHMYSVLDSDEIGMSYSGDCEEKGFHLMGFLDLGTRHIMTTQKTINSIEDLKNLKIRTMENQVQLDSFTAFGASPLPMAYGELYTALQQNIIDGAEAANTNYYSKKFYEAAPHWAMVGWTNDLGICVVAKNFYDSLSDEHKQIIDECTKEMIDKERELYTASEDECLELLNGEGIEITEPDREPFIEAAQSVYDQWGDKVGGRDKIDAIVNFGK
ncbi:C4-dicarboxylate ABC transporter substrate-binding protein [Clostridium sp. AF50-3]|jgi:tripartite ATP-independent transporter DctP family solute receptor|nr:C4-dicarboxylate ABC transporter substrate-binding protein [Clostridium sp. AF50-3]RHP16996.1 C4-dicarboxylate ABC transporter substrate-binding protein [Clostridium sp. AF35-15]RHQ86913.1 C4-dicarboxylate ABC transporter substrate-binding protein [Clostridium sp. AF22-10]RHV33776.1 C4-dicarboxylate ABC transporter substrate-binding protein [Clostridium sp. OM04-7]